MEASRTMHDSAILASRIEECLASPDVLVLCVIGGPCTGKTRAVKQWLSESAGGRGATTAYINCEKLAWRGRITVELNEVASEHPKGHYPMFDLSGKDVVVIDEAQMDSELVDRIAAHTSKDRSAYTHALLVLIVQFREVLAKFNLPTNATRICTPDGELCPA